MSSERKLFWLLVFSALALVAYHVVCDKIVFIVHVRGLLFDSAEPALSAPARPRPSRMSLPRIESPAGLGKSKAVRLTTNSAARLGVGAPRISFLEINPWKNGAACQVHTVIRDGRERGSREASRG